MEERRRLIGWVLMWYAGGTSVGHSNRAMVYRPQIARVCSCWIWSIHDCCAVVIAISIQGDQKDTKELDKATEYESIALNVRWNDGTFILAHTS